MNPQYWFLLAITLAFASPWAACAPPPAKDQQSIQRILDRSQQAMLERRYSEAVHILREGLKDHPADDQLRLELGRAYLSVGAYKKAIRLFREILAANPESRPPTLELAKALSSRADYETSNALYRRLLSSSPGDEAAAIGLASNLLQEKRPEDAERVVANALTLHADSLRLQEFKDRISDRRLGGEPVERRTEPSLVGMETEYFSDSGGNHSWRSEQRLDLQLRPGLLSRAMAEQDFQHSRDLSPQSIQIFSEQLRWRIDDRLFVSGGGGAVRFDSGDSHAIYETSIALKASQSFLVGANFSRNPIIPNADASSHSITAQGWEAYGSWTAKGWRVSAHGSRERYSDENVAHRFTAEAVREWSFHRLSFEAGYRFRHYNFDLPNLGHGYFSPDTYQRHLAIAGIRFQSAKKYRGEIVARGGAESVGEESPFSAAWDLNIRNELLLGGWSLQFNYSRFHLLQDTGAFRAEAGQFTASYHF